MAHPDPHRQGSEKAQRRHAGSASEASDIGMQDKSQGKSGTAAKERKPPDDPFDRQSAQLREQPDFHPETATMTRSLLFSLAFLALTSPAAVAAQSANSSSTEKTRQVLEAYWKNHDPSYFILVIKNLYISWVPGPARGAIT